jgi:group I intron endonuclease
MFIYRITNTINGKIYVGLDSKPVAKQTRWKSHLSSAKKPGKYTMVIHRAMRKYGSDNFQYEILEECTSAGELKKAEKRWIAQFRSNDPRFGYNRTVGGEQNYWSNLTDSEKEKHSKARRARMKDGYGPDIDARLKAGKAALPPEILAEKYRKAGEATARSMSKTYEVIDQNGNRYRIQNLRKFCRENDLIPQNMRAVIRGKQRHHRGWQCFEIDENDQTVPVSLKVTRVQTKEWVFEIPSGEVITVSNLKDFCAQHGLSYWSLTHIRDDNKPLRFGEWTLLLRKT